MKKILLAALTAVVAIGIAVPVALGATKPAPTVPTVAGNQLTCFDGTTDGDAYGLCKVTKYGVATLDNKTNDVTATTNAYDQYSGVYVKNSNLVGKAIGTINRLGFSYTGDAATAGAPRISLGIDTNRDGKWDHFAFISALYCNDGAGNVDVIRDSTCTIYGDAVYANWAAMVAAHPDYRVGYTPFVIADDPGAWTVFNVKLGESPSEASTSSSHCLSERKIADERTGHTKEGPSHGGPPCVMELSGARRRGPLDTFRTRQLDRPRFRVSYG